eukprot:TRINITY_DN7728_c0_g1_i1.p1 TRINITY_DN7728_c0_g1~~TRINITY_DN7728_c0_g1_i1.p1  ORF type:complete len:243 (-),score=45.57 TRINITY_DN7728_c0_g1_i1:41-769(-)
MAGMDQSHVRLRKSDVTEGSSDYTVLEQTRKDTQSTRRLALIALVVAGISVLALALPLLQSWHAARRDAQVYGEVPDWMEETIKPGWLWTRVPAVVRKEASKDSEQVGIVRARDRVKVVEVRGIRARISEPLEGWLSSVSESTGRNIQVLTNEETDEELTEVREKLLKFQKVQRDLIAALEKSKDKPATQQALEEMRHAYERTRAILGKEEADIELPGGETFWKPTEEELENIQRTESTEAR